MKTRSELWLRGWRATSSASARLVLFPHAGGGASFYRRWADDLSGMDVRVVQYPGREDRIDDAYCSDLHELAAHVGRAVAPLADLPLIFFGHSMGATVAYEVAGHLQCEGVPRVEHLFVSGQPAPTHPRGDSVHLRDDEELVEELVRLGATSRAFLDNPALRDLVLPAVREDYRLIETYGPRPGQLLQCPITACLGDRDHETTVDEMRGWAEHTWGEFTLRMFSGDHFYLASLPPELARVLLDCLGTSPVAWGPRPPTP